MKKLSSLSVFLPCYNDAKILPYLIAQLYAILPEVTKKFEMIVVNDGSTDDSQEILYELKKTYPNFKIITHKKNKGYGEALRSGFKNARYEWIFYTDGDGQYDPQELTKLVSKVTQKTDVINGYKMTRNDALYRKILGSVYNGILHFIYQVPIRDVDCDFRLIRKKFLRNIRLTSQSGTICLELVLKLKKQGARFKEVGIHHYERPIGHSQFFRFDNLFKTLTENIEYFTRRKSDA